MSAKEALADAYKTAMDTLHSAVTFDEESKKKVWGNDYKESGARFRGYENRQDEFLQKSAPKRDERVKRGLMVGAPKEDPAKEAADKMDLKPRFDTKGSGVIRKDK
jgi:hypothetical protein